MWCLCFMIVIVLVIIEFMLWFVRVCDLFCKIKFIVRFLKFGLIFCLMYWLNRMIFCSSGLMVWCRVVFRFV